MHCISAKLIMMSTVEVLRVVCTVSMLFLSFLIISVFDYLQKLRCHFILTLEHSQSMLITFHALASLKFDLNGFMLKQFVVSSTQDKHH